MLIQGCRPWLPMLIHGCRPWLTILIHVLPSFMSKFVPIVYHVWPLSKMFLEHDQPWLTFVYTELIYFQFDHGWLWLSKLFNVHGWPWPNHDKIMEKHGLSMVLVQG
jgi:hypothetical protein